MAPGVAFPQAAGRLLLLVSRAKAQTVDYYFLVTVLDGASVLLDTDDRLGPASFLSAFLSCSLLIDPRGIK